MRRLSSGSRWDGVDAAEAEQRWDWQFRTDNPVDLLATTVLDLLRPALSDDAS